MSKKFSLFKPRLKQRHFILSVAMMTAKMLFFLILIVGIAGTGVVIGVAKAWIDTTPQLDTTVFNSQAQTSFIYDKYGNLITEYKGTENRIYVSIDEIPDYLQKAVISIEDARFYSHGGVDLKRYAGVFIKNLFSGTNQGGSTITCQLVKLTMLSSEQSYRRKLQEAYLALQLEDYMLDKYNGDAIGAKNAILEEYLNTIYFGGSVYGVKTAAYDYFGKELHQLTLRECAALARMVKSPYKYNPRSNYYTRKTPEVIEDGADWVLQEMYEQGFITYEEYYQAKSQKLNVLEKSPSQADTLYDNAWYVEYAVYDVVTKMMRVEGLEDNATNRSTMENKLRTGGYHIYTSLDPALQEAAQKALSDFNNYPAMRYSQDATYRTKLGDEYINLEQPQAACAITNWRTGELVAIVGGRNEPTVKKQLNRAYQMTMPVGSSIKPISVYAPAIDLGWSPGTPVLNLPIPIEGWDSEKGYPNNFNGGSWTGCETMRMAMTKSHNYSTAQALVQYVGIDNSIYYLKQLGVKESHISATLFGLSLGGSGITPVEMTAAFGALANNGTYLETYAFTAIYEADKVTPYILIDDVQIKNQAFKPSTAAMIIDILEDCTSNIGTGSKARFGNFTVAGKTGTNTDSIGVFFAGMTGYYAGAVWIGHDNYKPLISEATGGSYAAPLWASIMSAVHSAAGIKGDQKILSQSLKDYGLVKAEACGVSGMKPTQACHADKEHPITTDLYAEGTEPKVSCNMHRTITLCARSKMKPSGRCTDIRTYSVLYIPVGHPLRQAETIQDVRKYFGTATITKDFDTCNVCR